MFKHDGEIYIKNGEFSRWEAQVVEVECEDCGHIEFVEGEELDECPECESDSIMNTTDIEETLCDGCEAEFDMWDDYYLNSAGEHLCEGCKEDAIEVDENEYNKLRPMITHVWKSSFKNEWVVEVKGVLENKNEVLIHHVGGFSEDEKEELNHLIQTCERLIQSDGVYDDVEGYQHWFAPSSLFESEWEGISPVIKRLSKDWSVDSTTEFGTPVRMTEYTVVQYDKNGGILKE